MGWQESSDIFSGPDQVTGGAMPIRPFTAIFDPYGRDEVADRVMREMAEGQLRAKLAATQREERDVKLRAEHDARMVSEAGARPQSTDDRVELGAVCAAGDEGSPIAKSEVGQEDRAANKRAYFERLEHQDEDFHAHQVFLRFSIVGACSDEFTIEDGSDPSEWEMTEDPVANLALAADMRTACADALEPWIKHFNSLGLVRSETISLSLDGEPLNRFLTPAFFLVHGAGDADLTAATLAEFKPVELELPCPEGTRMTITADVAPTNATILFDAMKRSGSGTGRRDGESGTCPQVLKDEGRDEWLSRVTIPRARLGRLIDRWVACGRDPYIFARFGDWTERDNGSEEITWVVDGIIPRGEVVLLAGASGVGKSSVAHSWLGALGARNDSPGRQVLGQPIKGRFHCCLIAGEEGAGGINYRERKHAAAWGGSDHLILDDPAKSLVERISLLHTLPNLDVVVIDTVGSFFDGDEKSDRAVREFLEPLVNLARVKGCAVILVHHLTKSGEGVKSIGGLKAHVRGAGAFVSTCRLAIGVIRVASDRLEVGPFKSNIPPELLWLPVGAGRQYWLNDQAYTLEPIRAKGPEASLEPEVMDFICDAIAEQNRLGRVVRRTGRHELWERKLPELEGIPRAALRGAIVDLIDADRVFDGPDGLISVFPTLGELGDTN